MPIMSPFSFTAEQDAEDRLTNWARDLPGGNGEQQTFGLTDVGDWNTYDGDKLVNGVLTPFGQTRTHTAVHEIETIDDGNQIVAIAHDAKGNLTLDEDGNTYTWNFDNRLKEVRNSTGDLLASHTYDALGRRTTTTTPGSLPGDPPVVTAYVHLTSGGMGQLLAEYEDNALVRQYTYGSYIDEPITLTRYNANLPGGEETLYYHRDRQYNVIGLTDATGTVIERYAYSPYGDRRVLDPDGITVRQTSAVGNPLGHQGLYHDEATRLIYNRARYFNTQHGRFTSRDPLQYWDGLSLYEYLSGQIYYWLDPSGLRRFGTRQIGPRQRRKFSQNGLGPTIRRRPSSKGHEWVQFPDGSAHGFRPFDSKDGKNKPGPFDVVPGGWVDETPYDVDNYQKEWIVVRKSSGKMRGGPNDGACCKDISNWEINMCIKLNTNPGGVQDLNNDGISAEYLNPPRPTYCLLGQNCRDRISGALSRCCAKRGPLR